MTLTYRNGVSIGEIAIYSIGLPIAVLLSIRHGFGRSSGWFFLIIFCLARIIGPAMQLATINAPTNTSLYTGYAILNNVGLSPLLLAALGFLSRLLDSIHRRHNTMLSTHILKGVEIIIIVGLILGIVGGINASDAYTKSLNAGVTNAPYHPGTLSKVGTALFIVSYVATVIFTIVISFSVPHAEAGEKRLFYAVAIALPLLLIRLIYSCLSTFSTNVNFNLLKGNTTALLCMALLEELVVVAVFETMGLSLKKLPKEAHVEATQQKVSSAGSAEPLNEQPREEKQENLALRIAKKTIIGHVIMAFVPKSQPRDVEMQDQDRRTRG